MTVTCPTCGLQTADRETCEHCNQRLRPAVGIVPPHLAPRPTPTPEEEEPIPMALPAPPRQAPRAAPAAPWPTPAASTSERIFARRVAPPSPRRKWPWIVGAVAGGFLFLVVAVGVAEMVARSSGESLLGRKPVATAASVDQRQVNDRKALERAGALPLSPDTIDKMLQLAKPVREETLIDLGCGDGQLAVRAHDKFGMFVVAYDSDEVLVHIAKRHVEDRQINSKVVGVYHKANVFTVDLSSADIIVVTHPERWGSVQEIRNKLEPSIRKLDKPGVRIVSTQPILSPAPWKTEIFEPPDNPGRQYTFFLYKTPLD